MSETPHAPTRLQGEITAPPSLVYRLKQYGIVLLLVGWGGWSLYDYYVRYPQENAEALKIDPKAEKLPHGHLDTVLNFWIGWVLPPVGLAWLVMVHRNSRGQYRLQNKTLTVPGHPPVPFATIRSFDKTHWEKKGIVYIHYELPNGKKGRLRLDDYIYEREPTDEIFKQIEEYAGVTPAPTAGPPGEH